MTYTIHKLKIRWYHKQSMKNSGHLKLMFNSRENISLNKNHQTNEWRNIEGACKASPKKQRRVKNPAGLPNVSTYWRFRETTMGGT